MSPILKIVFHFGCDTFVQNSMLTEQLIHKLLFHTCSRACMMTLAIKFLTSISEDARTLKSPSGFFRVIQHVEITYFSHPKPA